MSALAQSIGSETEAKSWTISTSPESLDFSINNQEIIKLSVQPVSNVMQGMCRLETGFEKLLPLFKGLISMGKPSTLSLIYDTHNSQVFFSYSLGETTIVERFFTQVISLLKKEVRFKQILEKVIQNKRKYQAEQALLQASMHKVAWD